MEALIFSAAFGQVFFLGLNAKFLRDDKIFLGALVSWAITGSMYAQTWVIANSNLDMGIMFFWGGLGGSMGITAAQLVHKKYFRRSHEI